MKDKIIEMGKRRTCKILGFHGFEHDVIRWADFECLVDEILELLDNKAVAEEMMKMLDENHPRKYEIAKEVYQEFYNGDGCNSPSFVDWLDDTLDNN